MKSSILLTGATGQLGSAIQNSGLFNNLLTPSRHPNFVGSKEAFDLLNNDSIKDYFNKHRINTVIHTAALARMRACEENPALAVDTNILGTQRLINAVNKQEQRYQQPIRFIYISTDGVYKSTVGNYKETSTPCPYNTYGITKLGGERVVRRLTNHCIIRTRFYDPLNLPFDTVARDAYSSALPLGDLVRAIYHLLNHRFIGIVNVGEKRQSDYARFKQINPSIKPCAHASIQQKLSFTISKDASMNTSLWQHLQRSPA